ncbi:MAG: rhomboid family intramembrane serine protease [Chloroflexi bacterium]|nr:rhomboid family intramembrane serine protease [Chloroflexota bacterium]
MSDNLTPKRPEDVTPDAQKDRKPQPVHPLMRRPPPSGSPDGQPPRRMARVVFNFARPARSYVTWALIAVNLAIFALTALIPSLENEVVRGFANQPAAVDAGEYWRLFTSMFLHANIIHVLMNMLALRVSARLSKSLSATGVISSSISSAASPGQSSAPG